MLLKRLLVLLCLVVSAPVSFGVEEPHPDQGLFNTPGYPSTARDAAGRAAIRTPGAARSPDVPRRNELLRGSANDRSGAERGANDRSGAERGAERGADSTDSRPPARPSEFQRFVERATGRLLPAFGSRFFAEAQDVDRSLGNVPVSADYVVGPGDEIVVRAWGSIDADYRTTVDRNGQINLPKVGTFNVAGVKASDLDRQLRGQIGRLFTNFDLNVSLGQLRAVQVFVVGPALRPGVYTVPSQSTLLSAVVAAGGPAPNGSMRSITLRRNGRVVSELDVYDFLVQGDKSKDVQLTGGDVVVFKPIGPQVALTGSIDTPAIYELRDRQQPLGELLRYAGGAPVLSSPNRVQLERIDPAQPLAARFVEQFRLDAEGSAKTLRDGDILTLLPISPQFANAVTLKGHVAQPLRSPYTPGMRIRDLIPGPEALISPDFYQRKNILVQIIDDSADFRLRSEGVRSEREPESRGRGDTSRPEREADLRSGATRSDVAGEVSTADRLRSEARQADIVVAERSRKTPAALFDEVNWEFAVVERLNIADLSTQIIPFNLGRAVLQGDPEHNILLQPGDVVTVYSQKDLRVPVSRQTRIVAIEGEVATPGVYQLQPGETLQQLLRRAGGFTRQAYLYGLEFTREETRLRQQENISAVISRLDAISATQAARDAANRRDDVGAATTVAVSAAATRAQRARLARLQPNGRIALELAPDARTIEDVPDVPLDNADRIIVPTRPGFVTVTGAVVNDNAFLWKAGRTAADYIKLAGLEESADPSAMFILHADGTVTHSNESRGLFGYGGLGSRPIYPGDAVVVPNQLDFESFGRALVRNLKDFGQIFYQFGLGAAAIRTLRN